MIQINSTRGKTRHMESDYSILEMKFLPYNIKTTFLRARGIVHQRETGTANFTSKSTRLATLFEYCLL